MDTQDQINRWLDSDGSYRDGVALLEALGQHTATESAWLARPFISSTAKAALRSRLLAFKTDTPTSIPVSKTKSTTEPVVIQEYRTKGRHLLKEYSEVKSRLNIMAEHADKYSNEDRYEVAAYIMLELIPAIDNTYDTIKAYEQDGTLPKGVEEASIIQQTVEKMLRLQSLSSRISRLNKYLKDRTLDKTTKDKYATELSDKLDEQNTLKRALNL